jgi:hypothetical protein
MKSKLIAIALFIGLLVPVTSTADTTIFRKFGTQDEHVLGYKRWPGSTNPITVDYFDCGIRIWSSTGQADFHLLWVQGLQPGDVVEFEGKACSSFPYSAMYSHFWTTDCNEIQQAYPCPLTPRVSGMEIDSRSFSVPENACGLVICAINQGSSYDVLDWVQVIVPDHALVVLPGGVVSNSSLAWGQLKALYR